MSTSELYPKLIRSFMVVFLATFVFVAYSQGAESPSDTDAVKNEATKPAKTLPKDIPPLDNWKDPVSAATKDLIAAKSPEEAANYIVDELLKAVAETEKIVNSIAKPDFKTFQTVDSQLANAQLKVRHLANTAMFLANLMPPDAQIAWKATTSAKISQPLNRLSSVFLSKGMLKAAEEMGRTYSDFAKPYFDTDAELKKLIEENAPKKSSSSSSDSYDSSDSYYSQGQDSYSSSGSGVAFEKQCTNFLAAYTPGNINETKLDSILTQLVVGAQKNFLNYTSANTGSGYYGSSDYSSSSSSSYSSTSSQRNTSGGLDFGDTPTTSGGGRVEIIDDTVRKCITAALKDIVVSSKPDSKIIQKAAIAYSAFEMDDMVPEISIYLEKAPISTKEVDIFKALPLDPKYSTDPRVQFLMVRGTIQVYQKNVQLEKAIIDAFSRTNGAAKFVVEMLSGSQTVQKLGITILFEIGDGDSAIEAAKLLKVKPDPSSTVDYRPAVIQLLGQIGDQRTAPIILRHLIDPKLQIRAQESLVRMGTPAEAAVISAFNAKMYDIDIIALDILGQIGSWRSLQKISEQLVLYTEARSSEELANSSAEEKPKLQFNLKQRNELTKKSIENGSKIVARMLGLAEPVFEKKKTQTGYGIGSGYDDSGYSNSTPSDYSSGDYSTDYYGSSSSSSAKKVDLKAPRTLAKMGDNSNPGSAPINWVKALQISGVAKLDEFARILGRVTNYENGLKSGEDAQEYQWLDIYYKTSVNLAGQLMSIMSSEDKKAAQTAVNRVVDRFSKVSTEWKRIQRSSKALDGYNEGVKKGQQTSGQRNPAGPR